MIRPHAVGHILGQLLLVLGGTMLIPLAFAAAGGKEDPRPILWGILITAGTGGALLGACRRPATELSLREGLLLVVSSWISVGFFGCLPFYFSPHFPSFTDALFESVSGFSTTGASILPDVEVLPRGLQFWRLFTHWLGGMGIVMLGIAVLPLIGIGGMQLYRAQFGGAKSETLRPRVLETARALWKIYAGLTVAEFTALRLAGMDSFEAITHTFSTLGTGGFSTRTASVAAFNSPAVEYVIVAFMILASINFTRHYRLWVERQPRSFFLDTEVRFHAALIAISTAVVTASLIRDNGYEAALAFRRALFQVTSIVTCTGFVTDDYEKWRPLPQLLLLALMFAGGNTGSTSGGLKTFRIVLLFRVVAREFKKMVERRGVFAVRVGGQVIAETTIQSLLNLVYLAFVFNFGCCLLLTAAGVDVITSISAAAATMFAVGPGLGTVGPADHYGHLPALAKWVLCGSMLAGRVEFYTALVVLTPYFWKK